MVGTQIFVLPLATFSPLFTIDIIFWYIAKGLTALFVRNRSSSLVSWSHTASSHSLFPDSQCFFSSSRLAGFLSSCHASSFVGFARSLCLCWIKIRCHIFVLLHSSALFLWTTAFSLYCYLSMILLIASSLTFQISTSIFTIVGKATQSLVLCLSTVYPVSRNLLFCNFPAFILFFHLYLYAFPFILCFVLIVWHNSSVISDKEPEDY